MILLELFCGTKSISKIAEKHNIECITLDNRKKCNPDIYIDILKWDYKNEPLLKNKKIDIIWVSPPCIEFSSALTTRPRNIKKGLSFVKKSFEIIEYFKKLNNNNLKWCMENPRAHLRKQEYMKQFNRYTTSYCKYGYPYRKHTDFWSNCKLELIAPCKFDCEQLIEIKRKNKKNSRIHKMMGTSNPPKYKEQGYTDKKCEYTILKSRDMRYSIPPLLCENIIKNLTNKIPLI